MTRPTTSRKQAPYRYKPSATEGVNARVRAKVGNGARLEPSDIVVSDHQLGDLGPINAVRTFAIGKKEVQKWISTS
ncbi:hypothetical protein U6G28_05625 [Actinomycetaceae bacterium MB13-C1-2]|nr:hypothetical protein U6G28_05625 [Actinomycetaceae bacterium MB13-C1-2]